MIGAEPQAYAVHVLVRAVRLGVLGLPLRLLLAVAGDGLGNHVPPKLFEAGFEAPRDLRSLREREVPSGRRGGAPPLVPP